MLWQLSFTSKSTLSQITLTHVIAYLVSFLHTDGVRHCILILLHSVVLYRTSVPLSASSLNCVPLLVGLHLCNEIVILPCSLQFLIYVILICCHFFSLFCYNFVPSSDIYNLSKFCGLCVVVFKSLCFVCVTVNLLSN